MARRFLAVAIALLTAGLLVAQERPQRGVIKKVDADKGAVTITVDGKDVDYKVVERTRLMDGDNKEITDRLKDKRLRKGAAVMFLVQDTKENVLRGMRLAADRSGGPGAGPGDIRRAKVKKIDLDGKVITLTVDGKDHDYVLTDETRVIGVRGDTLKERLGSFKAGTDVMFRAGKKDGKETLVGIGLPGAGGAPGPRPAFGGGRWLKDASKLQPLTEDGQYSLPGTVRRSVSGRCRRPDQKHASRLGGVPGEGGPAAGRRRQAGEGRQDRAALGRHEQHIADFRRLPAGAARSRGDQSASGSWSTGAQGGMTAALIQSADRGPGKTYWDTVDSRLTALGLTRAQVQVAWIKQADAGPREGFPDYPRKLQKEQANIVRLLHERFPKLVLVYLSSRT